MKFKSIIAGLLTLSVAFILASCGAKETAPTRTTITFWHGMTGARKTALNALIKDFNHAQSKYTVRAAAQGDFGTVQQKITAAAKAHNLPTIAQTTYTNVPDYLTGDFITPFDKYLPQNALAGVYPAFLQSAQYRGHYYSLPFSKSTQVMYYNADLLQKLHLSVPKSFEALRRLAPKLKKRGIAVLGFDQSFAGTLDALAYAAGKPLVTASGQVNIAAASTREATNFIWTMLQNGTAKTAGAAVYGNADLFKGKTLFYIGSSAGLATLEASVPAHFRLATAPLRHCQVITANAPPRLPVTTSHYSNPLRQRNAEARRHSSPTCWAQNKRRAGRKQPATCR